MSGPSRRSNYAGDTPVSYGSVGTTQAADVLVFPPAGFRSVESSYRLGSGQERFDAATTALMTWAVPRYSHLETEFLQPGELDGYAGIEFDDTGNPLGPAVSNSEPLFAPDGTPFINAGTTITLNGLWKPTQQANTFRVIYVLREERRSGYAWGSVDEEPVIGEEYFGVEWRDDDSVWSVVRSVTAVAQGRKYLWLQPLIRLRQWWLRRHYVRSLLPNRQV